MSKAIEKGMDGNVSISPGGAGGVWRRRNRSGVGAQARGARESTTGSTIFGHTFANCTTGNRRFGQFLGNGASGARAERARVTQPRAGGGGGGGGGAKTGARGTAEPQGRGDSPLLVDVSTRRFSRLRASGSEQPFADSFPALRSPRADMACAPASREVPTAQQRVSSRQKREKAT